jgi:MGT family glycosyltransferase
MAEHAKHIAFVSLPAPGHINPTLPLVEELIRRGHRVSYATGYQEIPTVEAVGATPVPLDAAMPDPPEHGGQFGIERLAGILRYFIGQARRTLPQLIEHFEPDRPDAVCYGMYAFDGKLLANKFRISEIELFSSMAWNETFSLHKQYLSAGSDLRHPAMVEFFKEMRALVTEHEMTMAAQAPMAGMPCPLNLVFIPKQFQIEGEGFDDRFRFLGPSLGSRAESDEWRPPVNGSPVLFISLGTSLNQRPDFYRSCFEAFAGSRWHVAMSIGRKVDPAELGEPPANFDVRPFFPQPAVLRHTGVFVSHCGMNSVMESLLCGVPLVGVPQQPEQAMNAKRVEELGLGKRLHDAEVTAALLRRIVDEVADDEKIRANVDRMSAVIAQSGGASLGADAIEEHLNAGPPA